MTQEFIDKFFSAGNALSLAQRDKHGRTFAERLEPWLARLRANPPRPSVLPRALSGGDVLWYGLAQSEKELRLLGEELAGFVGATYSDFNGQRASLDAADAIDAAVLEFTGGLAFKFRGEPSAVGNRAVWAALELMDRVLSRKPLSISRTARSTSWALRSLYMALQAGNRAAAEDMWEYLSINARLDTLNLLFLRVQILFELGLWVELRALSQWDDLLQTRRPADVTQALLTALYRCELSPFEETRDAAGALAHFKHAILPRHGPLFIARGGRRAPEILKSFMLLAANAEPPRRELQDEILALTGVAPSDMEYLRAIAVLGKVEPPPSAPLDFLRLAADADLAGDLDIVFTYAQQAPPSKQRTRMLFRCAMEIGTLAAERAAVDALHAQDEQARSEFLQQRNNREFYERIAGRNAGVPANWIDWLERLNQDQGWERAVEVARQGSVEWSIQVLLEIPRAGERLFEQLVVDRGPEAQQRVQEALPFLLRFFLRDDSWPRTEFAGLYANLLDLLAMQTECGDDDLELFNELFRTQSMQGLSAKRYVEIVGYAREFWRRSASVSKLDWALDMLDMLVDEPCPDATARQQLFYDVMGGIKKFERRVSESQWAMLDLLCADLNETVLPRTAPAVAEAEGKIPASTPLPPGCKMIGLYTLTQRVGLRAKLLLEKQYCGLEVRLNSDKVGTEALKQLAQQAGIFIMVTQSAKHAATLSIERHLPKSTPLLRPAGKGVSAIVRLLREHLAAQQV